MKNTQNHLSHSTRLMIQIAVVLCGIGVNTAALSETAETQAVTALGKLNGIALACEQPALSTRIRDLIVSLAPKNRETGVVFETATTDAFLKQGQEGAVCPNGKTLADQIEAQMRILQQQNQLDKQ